MQNRCLSASLRPYRRDQPDELKASVKLTVTTDAAALGRADFIIVAVPTPIDSAHQPDFGPLLGASEAVGRNMKRGATVVFESTVYPGATEEICVPVIEKHSGFKWKQDFFVGYSPERINPGIASTAHQDHQGGFGRHAGDPRARREHLRSVVTAGVHRRARSRWPRPPRSSRTRSAT
jgi:UDP-N-acetyl-D-galactosamine dehydrogenase